MNRWGNIGRRLASALGLQTILRTHFGYTFSCFSYFLQLVTRGCFLHKFLQHVYSLDTACPRFEIHKPRVNPTRTLFISRIPKVLGIISNRRTWQELSLENPTPLRIPSTHPQARLSSPPLLRPSLSHCQLPSHTFRKRTSQSPIPSASFDESTHLGSDQHSSQRALRPPVSSSWRR